MAKVKFGSGVSEIRGSIGGTVYARNAGGAYIRNRTSPIHPGSPLQNAAKALFANAVNIWTNTLSYTQRSMWNAYASAVPYTDVFGATRYYSGQQRFVQSYIALVNSGGTGSAAYTAPVTYTEASPIVPAAITMTQGATPADTTGLFGEAYAPADVEVDDVILIYFGNAVTPATTFFDGPYRYAGKTTYASGTTYPEVLLTDPWGREMAEDAIVPVKTRILKADMRMSPETKKFVSLGAYITP
ncbi:MAG: hypothetical protein PVI21_06550 [Candidatus Woesebacteria bacterium]|jgi:hypothetical protein